MQFRSIFVTGIVLAAMFIAGAAHAQATAPVAATGHVLDIQLTLTDQGEGFVSDGDDTLEPGESGALKFLVVNYGDQDSPGINLLMESNFEPLNGLYVELPSLGPGEGVEFETQLELPTDIDLSNVELSAEMFDAQNMPLADTFEWQIVDGALVAATGTASGVTAAAELTATAYSENATKPGTVKGVIIDIETGGGLAAGIIVRETKDLFYADENGYYAIELSAGTYTFSFNHEGKRERIVEGIRVEGGSATVIDVVLEPRDASIQGMEGATSVQEVVVEARPDKGKASVQLVIRQKAAVVSDALSSEEMSRAADSTASEAVKRAVGTSVVGGKFIFVRGLGERYSYTMLNGAKLPSPEPNRKVVPLDIFPTSVVQSVSIAKTAAPDIPADFAGGAVQIETKEFPDGRECKIGLSLGYTATATFKDLLAYKGGGRDGLGFDDGTRAFPGDVPQDGRLSEGAVAGGLRLDAGDLERIGKKFNNDYALHRNKAPVDISTSGTCGNTWTVGGRPLGVLATAKYSNGYERVIQIRRKFRIRTDPNSGETVLDRATDFSGETGSQNVSWNALANLNYSVASGHELDLVSLFTSKTKDEARIFSGFEQQFNGNLEYTSLRYVRRTLVYNQLSGTHDFGSFIFDWSGDVSLALRDEPDWRELVRTQTQGSAVKLWLPKSSSGSHFWSELREPVYGGSFNFTVPFLQWDSLESSFKTGVNVSVRDRTFDVRRLRFIPNTNADPSHATLEPSELFTDQQIGTNVRLEESSRPTDSYSAQSQVYAAYAMVDVPMTEDLRAVVGARYEHSDISVTTFDPFAPNIVGQDSAVVNDDVLPSVNLVQSLSDSLNLRLSGSQTVARPDFRELSPFALADFFGGQEVQGNPNLKQTKIWNVDLRTEWFPGEGEVLAASFFYKQFIDPIEQVIIPSAQQTISYENAEGAYNVGFEVEARRNFSFIDEKLHPLYSGMNFTWLRSRVKLDPNSGIQTRSERPLQGQSDLLFNAVAGVDFSEGAYVFQLSYNTFSKRIAQVGAFGMPDIFAQPIHSLNATYAQKIGDHFSYDISLENLLDEPATLTQGDRVIERDYEGISGSVGFSYEF